MTVAIIVVAPTIETYEQSATWERTPVLSYQGHETRHFREILDTISEVTGKDLGASELCREFVEQVHERWPSCEHGGVVPQGSGTLDCLPAGITVNRDSVVVQKNGDSTHIRLNTPLWKVARRTVEAAARSVPRETRGELRNRLWFLWVESALELIGQRYASYTYADELSAERAIKKGKSFGPGFWPEFDEDRLRVAQVWDPQLSRDGLSPGDIVVALDSDLDLGRVLENWLQSSPHEFTLSIRREDGVREIRGTTVALRHRSLVWQEWRDVVYARLEWFASDSLIELRRMARRVAPETQGLILDLRNNTGGRHSPGFVDCFLKPGQIVSSAIVTKTGARIDEQATIEYLSWPLVVLVNGNTASMSEVFVAAMKAHGRATIIGQGTFGKSVSQTVYEIGEEGELLLTTRQLLFPGGDAGWPEGIQPEIEIEVADHDILERALDEPILDLEKQVTWDTGLQFALETLTNPEGERP